MAPTNKAAWIPAARAHPMEVGPAEYPTVGAGELIVKAAAIAVNPMDWFIQIMGDQLFSFLKYPYCGGDDVAGTVVEVGSGVNNFKVGDRVFGVAPGFGAREGAFQEYVVLKAVVTSPIPASVTFEQASVLPLASARPLLVSIRRQPSASTTRASTPSPRVRRYSSGRAPRVSAPTPSSWPSRLDMRFSPRRRPRTSNTASPSAPARSLTTVPPPSPQT